MGIGGSAETKLLDHVLQLRESRSCAPHKPAADKSQIRRYPDAKTASIAQDAQMESSGHTAKELGDLAQPAKASE